jgi:hypothetical protein
MLIEAGLPRTLGGDHPRLVFGEEPKAKGAWRGRRVLALDGRPAFELSFWCGTCQLLFRRLEGANDTLSLADMADVLAKGLHDIDERVVGTFDALLPRGQFVPLLVSIEPRLVSPVQPGDYFAEEQVSTWGVDSFWGLPEYPRTAYYRTFETSVSADAHLYEFVVPMVPPAWHDPATVATYAQLLAGSSTPTAVAVSTLDVCAPAVARPGGDYYQHWGLTHFLLDGHHKVKAAAEAGRRLRLLALLSLDASLAGAAQTARLPALRRQGATPRAVRDQDKGSGQMS